jgi:HK97 family phage prohead protease
VPYPNEHAARINSPGKYVRHRRENDKFGEGIDVIWGIKEDGTTEVQAIRFDADKFTVAEAKEWLKKHDYKPIEFEEASKGDAGPPPDAAVKRQLEAGARRVLLSGKPELGAKAAAAEQDPDPEDHGWIEGYCVTWDNIDQGHEVVRKGALAKSIKERVPTGRVKLMVRHFAYGGDALECIGTVTEAKEDDVGGWFKAALASTPDAQNIRQKVLEGHIGTCSIGFVPVQYGWTKEGDIENVLEHTEMKMLEVTLTVCPMNEMAVLTAAKSLLPGTDVEKLSAFLELLAKTDMQALPRDERSRLLQKGFGSREEAVAFGKVLDQVNARLTALTEEEPDPPAETPPAVDHSGTKRKIDLMRRSLDLMLVGS